MSILVLFKHRSSAAADLGAVTLYTFVTFVIIFRDIFAEEYESKRQQAKSETQSIVSNQTQLSS